MLLEDHFDPTVSVCMRVSCNWQGWHAKTYMSVRLTVSSVGLVLFKVKKHMNS